MWREYSRAGSPLVAPALSTRLATAGLWVLAVLLAFRLVAVTADTLTTPSNGFAAYYTAARLVTFGADARRFYDDDWFRAQVQASGFNVDDIYHANPPTTAALLTPLASLDVRQAKAIWTLFSLLCLTTSLGLLVWQSDIHGPLVPGVVALALAYQPLIANLRQGQVYLFMLVLLTLAWYGYRRNRSKLLGMSLGLLLVLKTAVVLLWPLLVVARRWRSLAWGVAIALLAVSGSLVWSSVATWTTYGRALLDLGSRQETAVTAYQTQPGLIRHLLTYDAHWNPYPIADLPGLATLLTVLGVIAIAGIGLFVARMARGTDLPVVMMVTASLILSPVSADYHYTLLLLPIALLAAWGNEHRSLAFWTLLGLATFLLAADLPYQSPRFSAGISSLLAYPRLYGAWIIWGLALWASYLEWADERCVVRREEVGT